MEHILKIDKDGESLDYEPIGVFETNHVVLFGPMTASGSFPRTWEFPLIFRVGSSFHLVTLFPGYQCIYCVPMSAF